MLLPKQFASVEAKGFRGCAFVGEGGADGGEAPRGRLVEAEEENLKGYPVLLDLLTNLHDGSLVWREGVPLLALKSPLRS